MIPDFRIKRGGKPAIADIEKKTAYVERILNGIRLKVIELAPTRDVGVRTPSPPESEVIDSNTWTGMEAKLKLSMMKELEKYPKT